MKAIAAAIGAPIRLVGLYLALAVAVAGLAPGTTSAAHAQYRETISNDMRQCAPGAGPAVRVTVRGIKSSTGKIRLQSYRATKADWLAKGKW
ncbi:MAG: hypothetical protein AAFQ13_00365, partial [Pseudomonadota bacterium]